MQVGQLLSDPATPARSRRPYRRDVCIQNWLFLVDSIVPFNVSDPLPGFTVLFKHLSKQFV